MHSGVTFHDFSIMFICSFFAGTISLKSVYNKRVFHLSPMGPINELQRCPSRVWSHKGSTHLSPVHAYEFLSRCRYSTPIPRQPTVELFVLTYSRPHAFRYGNQKKNVLLLRLELTNSDLVGIRCTHWTTGAGSRINCVLRLFE